MFSIPGLAKEYFTFPHLIILESEENYTQKICIFKPCSQHAFKCLPYIKNATCKNNYPPQHT